MNLAFNNLKTRLHSSRMRTARTLTISPSMLCSGGVPGLGGGVYLGPGGCTWSGGGVPGPGGCTWSQGGGVPGPRGGCTWSRGGGGVPGPGGYLVRYSPPCEQNE